MSVFEPKTLQRAAGEMAVIIVGVLAALAMEDWYSNRVDARNGQDYVERIVLELEATRGVIKEHIKNLQGNLAAREELAAFFDGEGEPDDPVKLIIAAYSMGRDYTSLPDTSTYNDLVSTGGLRFIEEPAKREAIQRAYWAISDLERWLWPYRDTYLRGVRGWIPLSIIEQIRDACGSMRDDDYSCEPGQFQFRDDQVARVIEELSRREARLAFRLRSQGLAAALGIGERVDDFIAGAIETLRAP